MRLFLLMTGELELYLINSKLFVPYDHLECTCCIALLGFST